MPNVTPTPAQPESRDWHPCSHQAHVDELRIRYEDAASHPYDHQSAGDLLDAVGELLNHLDGLHRDETLVRLLAPEAS